METKTPTNSLSKKNEFAFCATMFFAPLIKKNLKTDKSLSDEDKLFINGYIKLGYFNISLLIIAIILGIIQFKTNNIIIQKISIGFLILSAVSLCIGTILAALNKNINPNKDELTKNENNLDLLLYFIPIYNIYIRYENHKFEGDNSLIKSSILLWALFTLSAIFIWNIYINIGILILIVFKIICTINGLSLGKKRNNGINNIFHKNPEEIRGYITGPIASLFNKKGLKNSIIEEKQVFEFLFKLDNKQIIYEYILLSLTCISGIIVGITNNIHFLIIGDIMIILRYGIMAIKRQHLPHLPIFRGITNIFFKFKTTKNE